VVLMSARPGRIEEIVPVPLPRPRSSHVSSVEASPEFAEITTKLWNRLRDMQTSRRHRAAGVHGAEAPAQERTA